MRCWPAFCGEVGSPCYWKQSEHPEARSAVESTGPLEACADRRPELPSKENLALLFREGRDYERQKQFDGHLPIQGLDVRKCRCPKGRDREAEDILELFFDEISGKAGVGQGCRIMKPMLPVLAFGGLLAAVSCRPEPGHGFPVPKAAAAESGRPDVSVVPASVENEVREKGGVIAALAFGVLSSRLGNAASDAGLTNAIAFCSVHGIALTKAVGVTNDVVLRRVTHRPRNPLNRANSNELEIIERFERDVTGGMAPTPSFRLPHPPSSSTRR
jgi:hypothetical protein